MLWWMWTRAMADWKTSTLLDGKEELDEAHFGGVAAVKDVQDADATAALQDR